jgi:hypothetical protein
LNLVLDPAFGFDALAATLGDLGWRRDDGVRAVTVDVIAGEPEVAGWTNDAGARLTYTFNPVVSLRVLTCDGEQERAALATRLPLVDGAAIRRLLRDPDPRQVLLGLLAARALEARALADAIAPLARHPVEVVRRAAESALGALGGDGARQDTLAVMRALCEQAIPVLAALVGPDGPARVAALRPQPADYARVFTQEVAARAQVAYEALWVRPPEIDRLDVGQLKLQVDAAPAGMLREENELSRHFPGGYRALAPYLQPQRIWFVWRYLRTDAASGMRYDGLVHLEGRWVWFPKPYRVVGGLLHS